MTNQQLYNQTVVQNYFETSFTRITLTPGSGGSMQTTVYINNFTYFINPSGSGGYFDLIAPVNTCVFSPSGNFNDPNALTVIFYVINQPNIFPSGTLPTNSSGPFTNGATVSSTGDGIYFVASEVPPSYTSYYNSTATTPYIDAYGRYIKGTNPHGVISGTFSLPIIVKATIPFFVGVPQGFWQTGFTFPTGVVIDREGYLIIESSIDPTLFPNTFPIITTKGHVSLEVSLDSSPPTATITRYTFSGAPIDLTAYVPTVSIANIGNGIATLSSGSLTTSASVQFDAGIYAFNIIVLPVPTFQKKRIAGGYAYNLRDLFQLDPNILETDFSADYINSLHILVSMAPDGQGNFTWPNASIAVYGGDVYVYGIAVASVDVVNLTITTNTIYAKVGKTFNLLDYITPIHPGDSIVSFQTNLADQITYKENGEIKINNNSGTLTTLNCTISLLGILVQFTSTSTPAINIQIVSSDTIRKYMSADYTFNLLTNNSFFNLIGTTEDTPITSSYLSEFLEVIFTAGAPNTFAIKVIKECLIIAQLSTQTQPQEFHLFPFQNLSGINMYGFRDSSTLQFTVNLTYGPEYIITDSSNTKYYDGRGGNVTLITAPNDLSVAVSDYNDGTLVIPLKIVAGESKVIQFVNRVTIQNVTPLPSPPDLSFVSISGSGIAIQRTPGSDYSQTLIVQSVQSSVNVYTLYSFELLAPVPTFQVIYFTTGDKYTDVLPMSNYIYPSTFVPQLSNNAVVGTITFSYGEINGSLQLNLYNGTSSLVNIYLSTSVSNVAQIHSGSATGKILPLPYNGPGYAITSDGSGNVIVAKTTSDVDVQQFFGVDNTGTITLYSFRNLPDYSHSDIYVYGTNTQWTTDVALITSNGNIPIGGTFDFSTFSSNEVSVTVNFPSCNPPINAYGNYTYTFKIIKESGTLTLLNVIYSSLAIPLTIPLANPILSYSITPPMMTPHTGYGRVRTSNCEVTIDASSLIIRGILPDGESEFYVRSGTSTSSQTSILKLRTFPLPYQPTELIEVYDTALPIALSSTSTPIVLATNATIVSLTNPPGTANTGNLVEGANDLAYTYLDSIQTQYNSQGQFTSTITVKSIPTPATFDTDRVIRLGETLNISLLQELFGSTNGYKILSAVQAGTGGGLTITNTNTEITLVGVQVNVIGIPYEVDVNIDAVTQSSLPNVQVSCKMYVIVWDRADAKQIVALADPTSPNPTQLSTTNFGNLRSVVYNGQVLGGTKHDALDWSDFDEGTITVSWPTNLCDNYFIFTSTQVIFLNVVVIPSLTPSRAINVSAADALITPPGIVDLLNIFYPNLENALIDAGINNPSNVPPSYTNFSLVLSTGTTPYQVPLTLNTVNLTTLQYTSVVVTTPVPINAQPSFVFAINTGFRIKSTDVSNNAVLTLDPTQSSTPPGLSARNSSDGIVVSTNVASAPPVGSPTEPVVPYSLPCILTNGGISTLPITIELYAYDPTQVDKIQETVYSTNATVYTFTSGNILSYSVGGVDHGLVPLDAVTAISGGMITVAMSASQPLLVVVVKLSTGKTGILEITYIIPTTTSNQIFLLNSDPPLPIGSSDISNIVGGTVSFNPGSYNLETNGFAIVIGGVKVGWVNNGSGNISLLGNQPGAWTGISFNVMIGTTTAPVSPYIETLASISVAPSDIVVEIGTILSVDISNYVTAGVGEVAFSSWSVSPSQPVWLQFNGSVISSTSSSNNAIPASGAGTYNIAVTVTSVKLARLTSTMSFNLVVIDSSTASTSQAILVSLTPTTVLIPGIVITVNGNKVNNAQSSIGSNATIINDVKLVFSGTQLQLTALNTNIQTFTLDIITENATRSFVVVSQIASEKDMTVYPQNYTGTLFKNSTDNLVQKYTIGSSQVYNPGSLYSLPGGGTIIIYPNGQFKITNASAANILVSYTPSGSSQNLTLNFTLGGKADDPVYINQYPASTISLGKNVDLVFLAGSTTPMTEGTLVDLGYATFVYQGDTMTISNVLPGFNNTLVQAENILSSQVKVISMFISLRVNQGQQTIYKVPLNSQTQFILPYSPTKITYDTMLFDSSEAQFSLFSEGVLFGTILISGESMNITTTGNTGLSKPIGFMDNTGVPKYAIISSFSSAPAITKISLGTTILPPPGDTFSSIGLLDGSQVATVNSTLAFTVVNNGSSLTVLTPSLTASFTFYATTAAGLYFQYTIPFVSKSLYVSNLKSISTIAFLGTTPGIPAFSNSGVSATASVVSNPNSLQILTMISPFAGRFTLNQVSG